MHLFFSRLAQFLVVWADLRRLVLVWKTVATSIWALWCSVDPVWRVIVAYSIVIGILLVAWLLTWSRGRARLRRGKYHHRGAGVIDASAD